MTDAEPILESAESVVVVDWPTKDVPETFARAGYAVFAKGGPGADDYITFALRGGEVVTTPVGRSPDHADLVYAHRPVDELANIVTIARDVGARTVWLQSGLRSDGTKDPKGCWMPRDRSEEARQVVEAAGLAYVDHPYIADVIRQQGIQK
jgi:predicted CoA-binding protein